MENSYDLLALLDRHSNVRGVVSGHLHLADEVTRRQVHYLLAPSTCIQLRHRHPLSANNRVATPVGARLIDLHPDGRIESEMAWASLD
jgi:Icc protein